MEAKFKICDGDMLKVDGCKFSAFAHEGKHYSRVKIGDSGDFYEGGDSKAHCTDCGTKYGFYHHDGCDCEP